VIELKVKKLSGLSKISGLLGVDKAYPVFFKTRFGIHTFGLRFPIDVIVLNKDNKVVRIKEDLQPNKIFIWNPKHDKVLELPAGKIKKLIIKFGERIKIQFNLY
jgi:uncharacterized membrane protein (UPF0127 family)